MTEKLAVRRVSDSLLVECLRALMKQNSEGQVACTVVTLGSVSITLSLDESEDSGELSKVLEGNGSNIFSAKLSLTGLTIQYFRGGLGELKSPYIDEVHFEKGQSSKLSNGKIIEIALLVTEKLVTLPSANDADFSNAEQIATIHSATLSRLEQLNEDLIRGTHKYRVEVDKKFSEREAIRADKINKKSTDLEEEYKTKVAELERKESELEDEKEKLDSRSNTHARRQLRRDILNAIEERQKEFRLTKGTSSKRIPVAIAMGCLFSVFAYLVYKSTPEFYNALDGAATSALVVAATKQSLYVLGATVTILYYIRWQNRGSSIIPAPSSI